MPPDPRPDPSSTSSSQEVVLAAADTAGPEHSYGQILKSSALIGGSSMIRRSMPRTSGSDRTNALARLYPLPRAPLLATTTSKKGPDEDRVAWKAYSVSTERNAAVSAPAEVMRDAWPI